MARAGLIAARDGAELIVLHVFDAPWRELHYRAPSAMPERFMQEQFRAALERRLAEFVREATGECGEVRSSLACVEGSSPRSVIVEFAKERGADLIALGTRGKTTLKELLLGSTAERVLQETSCTVLAVKPAGFTHPIAP